jgi:hypothetical protein
MTKGLDIVLEVHVTLCVLGATHETFAVHTAVVAGTRPCCALGAGVARVTLAAGVTSGSTPRA